MEIILSNEQWFSRYTKIRNSLLLLLFLTIGINVFSENDTSLLVMLANFVCLPLILTLLAFDYFQKPVFFELSRNESGLSIGLYEPDSRYLFFFDPGKKKVINIQGEDKIEVFGEYKTFPWQRKMQFLISRNDDSVFQSKAFDFSWASRADFGLILRTIEAHNLDEEG